MHFPGADSILHSCLRSLLATPIKARC